MTSETSNVPRVLEEATMMNYMFPVGSTIVFLDEGKRSTYYSYLKNNSAYDEYDFETGEDTDSVNNVTLYYVKRTK